MNRVKSFPAWLVANALMGNLLDAPITDKVTSFGENGQDPSRHAWRSFATSTMQGWRSYNEDTTSIQPPMFGVFDGHAGSRASTFCSEHLISIAKDIYANTKDAPTALKQAFMATDALIIKPIQDEMQRFREKCPTADPELVRGHLSLHLSEDKERNAGTTACVAFIEGHTLFVANAGDSRAVLCRSGRAVPLSTDHKPDMEKERKRVVAAEGMVFRGRVDGALATSRALGDPSFKQQMFVQPAGAFRLEDCAVTPQPEITQVSIVPDIDTFFVIATDGIWDVMTNQQVVDFVLQKRSEKVHPTQVCEQLLDACIANEPNDVGTDNMSIVLVIL